MVTPLCRCICGSDKDDPVDLNQVLELDRSDAPEEEPSAVSGLLSYSTSMDQPLRGVPIREGQLWLLSAEEEIQLVTLSLYVNGFSFNHRGREQSFSLSPFSLVRNCKFQAVTCNGVDLAEFKCFKVSLFTQGACLYFGVSVSGKDESEAEEDRSRWVIDISRAMRLVTQSLFPPFSIRCDPLASVTRTHCRIMAGYLVHHEDVSTASVLYAELHPQQKSRARLLLYENELCQVLVVDIAISERTTCCEKVGISCSCFSLDDQLFSTRTLAERKLWLRAISNIKVKLQNRAPSPSDEEIKQYRFAIKDHIHSSKGGFQNQAPMDALLQLHAKSSVKVAFGADDLTNRSSLTPPEDSQLRGTAKGGTADAGKGCAPRLPSPRIMQSASKELSIAANTGQVPCPRNHTMSPGRLKVDTTHDENSTTAGDTPPNHDAIVPSKDQLMSAMQVENVNAPEFGGG